MLWCNGDLVTEAFLLWDLVCGIVCLLICERWLAANSLGDSLYESSFIWDVRNLKVVWYLFLFPQYGNIFTSVLVTECLLLSLCDCCSKCLDKVSRSMAAWTWVTKPTTRSVYWSTMAHKVLNRQISLTMSTLRAGYMNGVSFFSVSQNACLPPAKTVPSYQVKSALLHCKL